MERKTYTHLAAADLDAQAAANHHGAQYCVVVLGQHRYTVLSKAATTCGMLVVANKFPPTAP